MFYLDWGHRKMHQRMYPLIDAHIHIDHYEEQEQKQILRDCAGWNIEALIAVSNDLPSARATHALAQQYPMIKPACGFHPEQPLPPKQEIEKLLAYIDEHHEAFIAIGEVGLPYYSRKEDPTILLDPYIALLEQMIQRAARFDKPIVLHAIYEDASIVCDLLEAYNVSRAHFHWFKGDHHYLQRMKEKGYMISITPDALYEEEIKEIIAYYPLNQLMVETDGPWPFEGKFTGQMTHPRMMHDTVQEISAIKKVPISEVYETILASTKDFYQLI